MENPQLNTADLNTADYFPINLGQRGIANIEMENAYKEPVVNYTPEIITHLPPNSIFVYGSNQYAIHGAGSAKAAVDKFGAIYKDVPMGLCGQSYGIITKSFNNKPCTLEFIKQQIDVLYSFATYRPELTFYVTKIGTALAGFTIDEIASLFKSLPTPSNIILPKEFTNL